MKPRERWQALQARLTAARSLAESGDRKGALREVDAALELDPNFLAAHSLRDLLLSARDVPVFVVPRPPTLSERNIQASPGDGYAQFEQRARRRRVDRKIEAARTAIARRKLKDAASALDEIIELDSNLPELAALTAQFDNLRRNAAAPRHAGRWIVAAASFAIVLGATWIEHGKPLLSLAAEQTTMVAGLVAPPSTAAVSVPVATDANAAAETPVTEPAAPVPAATSGVATPPPDRVPSVERERPLRAVDTAAVETRPEAPPARAIDAVAETRPTGATTPAAAPASLETPPPPPVRASDPIVIPPVPLPTPGAAVTPGNVVRTPNDEQLVKQALQRYRTAYEGLDASSASAVYPAVNEAALARAFNGLESQSLTFDSCDVQVRGDVANATCRGSARYVPKVGSREPRTEPRTWTFELRRSGSDWKIDNARAAR